MSALKVYLMDAMCGADLRAFSTAYTFIIVDYREVIDNGDSLGGAGAGAFAASDTAVCAIFSRKRAFISIGACHGDAGALIIQGDDIIGAGADANSASDAFYGIDFSNAVNY